MQIPGDIYLCQVSDHVSCGACCGLYNLPDSSRPAIEDLLRRRTDAFAGISRQVETIDDFGRKELERITGRLPLPEFHHCPYIGLIGPGKTRVGCLLHPLAEGNEGVDFRGLSHYGSMTCNMYFCPTHHRLAPEIKTCMREAFDHWYDFGLIVTETDFIESCFGHIEKKAGGRSINRDSVRRLETKNLLASLFSLKFQWPYACPERPLPNYFFNDRLYTRPEVDYSETGSSGSRYDTIFRELHSCFASGDELCSAEEHLDRLFDQLAGELVK